MPLKKPKPKTFSQEEISSIMEASQKQTGKVVRTRTYDPDYPVFDIPVNQKVLAYVPNHTVQNADGGFSLQMDKFAAHDCNLRGREYYRIRCTSGIVNERYGLDGGCPFCDAVSEVWDLVNKEFSQIVKSKGGNPDDDSARETYKSIWQDCKQRMAVQGGRTFVTFPIVVIECEEKDGRMTTQPKKDENGGIKGHVQWYTVSEKIYNDKWLAALETAPSSDDIPPTSPAGLWVILNYEYQAESGKHTKMASANSLKVGYKQMHQSYDSWAAMFDEQTADWTPFKAMEVLVDNTLRDAEEQQVACDELMKATRDKLAMFSTVQGGAAAPSSGALASAEDALASFGATEVPPQVGTTAIPSVPQAGATAMPNAPQVGITTEE